MDGEDFDNANANPKSELGKALHELDKEIKLAEKVSQFEITERIKEILRTIAEMRAATEEGESTEQCYERLLEDAEKFAEIYRERGSKFVLFCHYLT